MNPQFWRDKHVLITGASSGIGWELALQLAQRGARLGLLARRAEKLAELAEKLRAQSACCAYAAVDVADRSALRAAIERLQAELGPCDVLVAGAGIHRDTPGDSFSAEDFAAVHQTNVLGVANAFDAVLPTMLERRGGRIVAISSLAAVIGLPFVAAYSSSKAAVERMVESLRVDLKRHGIVASVVLPGFVETPMVHQSERTKRFRAMPVDQAVRRILRGIESGRARIAFPRRAAFFLRVLRGLPFRAYERVARRLIQRELDRRAQ